MSQKQCEHPKYVTTAEGSIFVQPVSEGSLCIHPQLMGLELVLQGSAVSAGKSTSLSCAFNLTKYQGNKPFAEGDGVTFLPATKPRSFGSTPGTSASDTDPQELLSQDTRNTSNSYTS